MPKRIALRLINLVWYGTALLIVLTAALVAIGREMLPQIQLDNPQLLRYAREQTGAAIEIGELRGSWTSLYPDFTAKQVSIRTPSLSVEFDQARLEVDILRSLWSRTPVFDRLILGKASVHYTPPASASSAQVQGPAPTADIDQSWRLVYLLFNKNIRVQEVYVSWQQGEQLRELQLQDFRLEQTLLGKKVFVRLAGADGREQLYAIGKLQGDSLSGSQGELYLKMSGLPLQPWLPVASENQADAVKELLQQPWLASGEAWLDWRGTHDGSMQAVLQLQNPATGASLLPQELASHLSARWQASGKTVLDLHTVDWRQTAAQDLQPLLQDVRLTLASPTQWQLQTPALALQHFQPLEKYLPAGTVQELMQKLHPNGLLRNVDLQWDNSKPLTERMQLRANAEGIATGTWHGVPAFTGVSGYLHSGIGYGYIDLDSRDGFSMHYPEVYHQPMQFQRAGGRVQWQWQPELETVLVGSDFASLSGEAGEARGSFWLQLPLPGADFHSQMYLGIGLRNSEARHRDTFLPYILPQSLLAWLKDSIGKADVPAAGFFYRGALSGNEPLSRAIQFFADIKQGELRYDPAWPRLTGLNARLLVDDGNAFVRAWGGQLYNTAIEGAAVELRQQSPGLSLHIQGRARGYAGDGLRILRETPLHKVIGGAMDSWQMPQGLLSTTLQLQIPLAGAPVPQTEDVRIALFDTRLAMDDLKLQFNAVQGELRYDTATGLRSPGLSATLFDKPLQLTIDSRKSDNNLAIRLDGKGSTSAAAIAQWSGLKPLQMLAGDFSYRAQLSLDTGSKAIDKPFGQFKLDSDLAGVTVPLPAPFATTVKERKPLAMTVDLFAGQRQDYRLDYNRQLTGAMSVRGGELFGGELVLLGPAAQLPQQAGPLQVRGNLQDADLQQWVDLITAFNRLPASTNVTASNNSNNNSSASYPAFTFAVNNARWRDIVFPQLQLSAQHEGNAWRLYFDAGNARGSAAFHDDPQRVPTIILSELKLESARNDGQPSTKPSADNNASMDFAAIPSLDIRIDNLVYNGMGIGNISTSLRSSADALVLEKLLASGPGYSLYNQQGNDGALLAWRRQPDGSYRSEFRGLLHMQGEQPALAHLGVDPFVRGKNIYVYADLNWPGTPAAFDLKNLAGDVVTRGEKGQYLQIKPNAAMQALSVIDITTWARRLRLDFSDLSNDGISFDEFKGRLAFRDSRLSFTEPLKVESPSSTMVLSGTAMLREETLDLQLNATLPVGNNATWIAGLAGGLPAAAGVYLVSKVFDNQIKSLTSLTYRISGPMAEPDIRFEKLAPPKKE